MKRSMLWLAFRRNKLLLISALSLIIILNLYIKNEFPIDLYFLHWGSLENTSCHYYYDKDDLIPYAAQNLNPPAESIFFIETSCKGDLDSRQICSVESAANHHPDWQVNVLFAGPVPRRNFEGPGLAVLRGLKKVKLLRIDVKEFAQNTPLEEMVAGGALNRTKWRISHTSDVLRFLTLYKFGGVYLDLDVVVAKPLWSLAKNWAARESGHSIGSAVLAISRDELGRKFALEAVIDIKKNYRGDIWGQNGPAAITRVLRKMCSVHTLEEMSAVTCDGFEVYGPQFFFPIAWEDGSLYFKAGEIPVLNAYAYHVWNKMTHGCTVHKDSPYAKLARAHCPVTYRTFGDKFGL